MRRLILIIAIVIGIGVIVAPVSFCTASDSSIDRSDIREFILRDTTDQNEYIIGEYVCRDYVQDVVCNARKAGFETYPFFIHEVNDTNETHAIVVFPTATENIYVDVTQGDRWVYIDFSTMEYEVYTIDNNLLYSGYIDWYLRGE